MDCLFCKIINGDIPSYKIFEDESVVAFLDINPESPGHTLIIPKKHFKDIDDIDQNQLNHILKIAKYLKKVLYDKLNCNGLTFIQNNGCIQEIKHFHLHLIPRYEKDNNLSVEEAYSIIIKN